MDHETLAAIEARVCAGEHDERDALGLVGEVRRLNQYVADSRAACQIEIDRVTGNCTALANQLADVTDERDRARRWAVHLEQENAEKAAAIERVLTYAASLLVRHPGMTVTADVVWQLREYLKLEGQPAVKGTKRYHCPRCGDMQVCARCEPELAAEVRAEREAQAATKQQNGEQS